MTSLEKNDPASDDSRGTDEIATGYVAGFAEREKRENVSTTECCTVRRSEKRRRQVTRNELEMCEDPDNRKDAAKRELINAYLETCSVPEPKHEFYGHDEIDTDQIPTENSFVRDGEEIYLDDDEDGLSSEYLTKYIFLNVHKTLTGLAKYRKTLNTQNKQLKTYLVALENDMKNWDSRSGESDEASFAKKPKKVKYFLRITNAVKSLLLTMDTSRGGRRLIVNHLQPMSCVTDVNRVGPLIQFYGFEPFNDYNFANCKFNIPIKLIFLGNMDFYNQYSNSEISYNIQLSTCFGNYFYRCLETIYKACYSKLAKELYNYQKRKTSGYHPFADNDDGDDFDSRRGRSYLDSRDDSDVWDMINRLIPHDNIRILGTSGSNNQDSRLTFLRYNDSSKTVAEVDPTEGVDAIFVSSFIRIRVKQDGGVYMDVYSRRALRLVGEDEDEGDEETGRE